MSALPLPLDLDEARSITARIRALVADLAETQNKVVELIEQAKAGEVWRTLGYDSWVAYVAGEFSTVLSGLERAERIPIVAKLSETGLSQRTIAAVANVSVGTINSDLASGVQAPEHLRTQTHTSGLDNKTYLRNGRPTAAGMTALASAVPAVRPKSRRPPLPDAYARALYDLERVINRLQRLHADDRFANNRANLGGGSVRPLDDVAYLLDRLKDDLNGRPDTCDQCERRIVPTFFNWRDNRCEDCQGAS